MAACRLSGRRATTVVPATRVAAEASLAPFNPLYHFAAARNLAAQIIFSVRFN